MSARDVLIVCSIAHFLISAACHRRKPSLTGRWMASWTQITLAHVWWDIQFIYIYIA